MRIYRKPNKAIWNSIITIGSFDGVHRGHQAVIKKLLNTAKSKNSLAGVVTFEPSPQLVIHPDFHYILTPFSEKQVILADSGIDFIFLIEFTKSIQSMPPARFVQSQILNSLHPTTIVVGYDHQFGKDGQGSIELLKNLSDEFD
ncbi:MAG: riboflavin biosynthesis protein RibF, partial [candidate division WOR-3 bacterium]|nr:riboflavin biosynthesis protein RibF [candidate division WOR-3 bacterium]